MALSLPEVNPLGATENQDDFTRRWWTSSRRALVGVLALAVLVVIGQHVLTVVESDHTPQALSELDAVQRSAIVADAGQALRQHLKTERNGDPPNRINPRFWGDAITKLKPIRVYTDRMNVAIVISETAGMEEGLYVSMMISSYSPQVGKRFTQFTSLSTAEDASMETLFHYQMQQVTKGRDFSASGDEASH